MGYTSASQQLEANMTLNQLREFNKIDFDTFGGVETEHPMIGETEVGTVILDGCVVQFFASRGDEWLVDSYHQEFKDNMGAIAVAKAILNGEHTQALVSAILTKIS